MLTSLRRAGPWWELTVGLNEDELNELSEGGVLVINEETHPGGCPEWLGVRLYAAETDAGLTQALSQSRRVPLPEPAPVAAATLALPQPAPARPRSTTRARPPRSSR